MIDPKRPIIGVAWYKKDQWNRLLDISEDASELEETFEEWKSNALKKIKSIEKQGAIVEKIPVDTEELLAWCNTFRLSVNSRSRTEYVTKSLMKLQRQKKASQS